MKKNESKIILLFAVLMLPSLGLLGVNMAIANDVICPNFDDLLDIRVGSDKMMMGNGDTAISTISNLDDWIIKANALKSIYDELLGTPPEDYKISLDPKIEKTENKDGYVHKIIAYNVAKGERIRAHLLIPRNVSLPAPAVITLHPTTSLGKEQTIGRGSSEKDMDRAYGLHLVRRGFITLSYDQFSVNERCYPGLNDFDTAPFYKLFPNWSVTGKNIWDVSRAIDLLELQKEVDTSRIACLGHSQGGGIAIRAMVFDHRIKVGVSSCGFWPSRLSKNPFNRCRSGWYIGTPRLRPFAICGKPFPVDMHELLALIAPRKIMVIMALNDGGYDISEIETIRPSIENLSENVDKIFEIYKNSDGFKMVLHEQGHGFEETQREIAYNFLEENLKEPSSK